MNALIEYRKGKSHDITVVFDGWKTGEARESQSATGGIKVIYSRIGEKADSVIKTHCLLGQERMDSCDIGQGYSRSHLGVGFHPCAVRGFSNGDRKKGLLCR